MSFQHRIEVAESTIQGAGLTLSAFWKRVPVHGTTWQRWRNGITKPRMETWERVESELKRLTNQINNPTNGHGEAAE